MSAKSKAKAVGVFLLKYVLTAGIGALADRYVKGAAARAIKDAANVATGAMPPTKLTTSLQADIDRIVRGQVVPSLQQQQEAWALELERRLRDGR